MSEFKTAIQYTVSPDCVVVKQVWGEGPYPRSNPPRISEANLLDADRAARFILDVGQSEKVQRTYEPDGTYTYRRLKSDPYRTFV